MIFATIWAFLMGKNAVENGIKDAQVSKWSRQNAVMPATNTYIDAKGIQRDAATGSVRFTSRDINGDLIGYDIFGHQVINYTVEKSIKDFQIAKANQDQFHTVVRRNANPTAWAHAPNEYTAIDEFQDLNDPRKTYVIEKLYMKDAHYIPVYVDKKTAKIARPIDEYMEFTSHDEYYENKDIFKRKDFVIRDRKILNAVIAQRNALIYDNNFHQHWHGRSTPNEIRGEQLVYEIKWMDDYKRKLQNFYMDNKKIKYERGLRNYMIHKGITIYD